jgi:hypothetical protein
LRRLREALYLHVREDVATDGSVKALAAVCGNDGRLRLGRKDPRFWHTAGLVLDMMHSAAGRVSSAAAALGITTGNLVDFLRTDPKVWQQANVLRTRFGHKPLID